MTASLSNRKKWMRWEQTNRKKAFFLVRMRESVKTNEQMNRRRKKRNMYEHFICHQNEIRELKKASSKQKRRRKKKRSKQIKRKKWGQRGRMSITNETSRTLLLFVYAFVPGDWSPNHQIERERRAANKRKKEKKCFTWLRRE